jgi:hypothetical protein
VTVELYEREIARQAANRDVLSLAAESGDLDAGDPLQGLRHVLGREFANILGRDGVYDYIRIALGVDRVLEAAAYAGDNHLLEFRLAATNLLARPLRLR